MNEQRLVEIEAEHRLHYEPLLGAEECGCGMAYTTDEPHPCYVPDLVAEVRRLRAVVQAARAWVEAREIQAQDGNLDNLKMFWWPEEHALRGAVASLDAP